MEVEGAEQMGPVRGIPTSRAYWGLKAEQVLNRVFEPNKPIEVEVCDTPSFPIALHDLPTKPKAPPSPQARSNAPRERMSSGTPNTQAWIQRLSRQPSLVLAGASVTVMVVASMVLVAVGIWHQSQQAIRQERNILLIERLRTMGPGATDAADEAAQAATSNEAGQAGEVPPPPPGEPWMEELASLPPSSAPAAEVLQVPVNSRITSPAPAATGSANRGGTGHWSSGGGGSAPQLVGVVQVPGQSGSAIFQIGGSSTSAAVGESIGSSGWRLRSAGGDSAVIEKAGEQRRVSISSGF
jgi:hypothetical protein